MSNKGYFDLSGIFHVQKNYLTDLSNSYPDVNNAPLVASYVHDLQNKIIQTADDYKDANTSANAVLDQQNAMITIIDDEQKRLDEKKASIDNATMEEERKTLLTNSQRLRAAEYTKIIIVAIICLCIHIGLRMFSNAYINEETSKGIRVMIIFAYMTNIIICGIIIMNIYLDIQSRSQINFNELVLPPPNITVDGGVRPKTADYDNLFSGIVGCFEKECCAEGTTWDSTPGIGKCISTSTTPAPTTSAAPTTKAPTTSTAPTTSAAPTKAPTTKASNVSQLDKETAGLEKAIPSVKKTQSEISGLEKDASTATKAATPTATRTATPTATRTATPTATKAATPTATRTATPTATRTATPTATRTATPTATKASTPTATKASTPTPTVESFVSVNRIAYMPDQESNLLPRNTTNMCSTGNETNNFGFLPGNYINTYVPYK